MERAYSLIEVKSLASDAHSTTISGLASTPTPDRMGDIVEPLGARFALPMPLLWQHDATQPVGHVEFAQPTEKGIPFRAVLPHVKEAGRLKERVDEAIHSLKYRLVGAVSIGFRAIEGAVERLKTGGVRFKEWEWVELSLVTIPANAEATISTVRALDSERPRQADNLAAPGRPTSTAGATATTLRPGGQRSMNVQEQIRSLEATHASLIGQQTSIMDKARAEGRTLDTAEQDAFDGLTPQVDSVLKDIERCRHMERAVLPKAKPVAGQSQDDALQARAGSVITIGKPRVPKGTAFVRYAMALANSRGSISDALMFARRWNDSTPEVIRALEQKGTAGSTTDSDWAAPLAYPQQLAAEFLELLRPATVIGKLNLRRVPFNVRIARQTSGSTVAWVGEGLVKPTSDLAFDYVTMAYTKVAGIVVITEELARLSSPSAEDTVRQDMIAQIAQYLDEQFLDPAVTASAGVRPASVTNTATPVPSTGDDAAALRCDLRSLFTTLTAANISVSGSALVMSEVMATSIGMMTNALGQPEFGGIGAAGGTLAGVTVVTSQSTALEDIIVLIKQSEVLLADDGGVQVDVSREATLDLANGTAPAFSLWQRNCVGIRAERWINWQKARDEAVGYISGADYGACAAP
jgi:HK97 family phage major capsid protein/HK97 family phage prohead protease